MILPVLLLTFSRSVRAAHFISCPFLEAPCCTCGAAFLARLVPWRKSRCSFDGLESDAPGLGLGLTWILRTSKISPAALALMSFTPRLDATAMAKGKAVSDSLQLVCADMNKSDSWSSRLPPI